MKTQHLKVWKTFQCYTLVTSSLRKEVKISLESAHNYVNNLLGDIRKDSKPFWKYISSQKKDNNDIPPLRNNQTNTTEYSDLGKAEVLISQVYFL